MKVVYRNIIAEIGDIVRKAAAEMRVIDHIELSREEFSEAIRASGQFFYMHPADDEILIHGVPVKRVK